jgi:hypothetical protein
LRFGLAVGYDGGGAGCQWFGYQWWVGLSRISLHKYFFYHRFNTIMLQGNRERFMSLKGTFRGLKFNLHSFKSSGLNNFFMLFIF